MVNKKYGITWIFMKNSTLENILFEHSFVSTDIYNFNELLENRLDFIKKSHGAGMASVIDALAENQDPTKNKKYTEWLVDRHLKGEHVWLPKVRAGLEHFSKAQSSAHDTNIKNHTVASMLDVAHMVKTSPKNKQVLPLEKMYDEDGVTGFKIPNKDTSIKQYGIGQKHSTKWCTAANSTLNMFDRYDGGKYTMHFPNNHFLQFNHSSQQCKDPSDAEIDFSTDARYSEYAPHIAKFMQHTSDVENVPNDLGKTRFGVSFKDFTHAWENKDKNHKEMSTFTGNMQQHPLTNEQHEYAIQFGRNLISKNPHLTESQVLEHITTHKTPQIFKNPALKGHTLDRVVKSFVDNDNELIQPHNGNKLRLNPNLQSHHIDAMIDKLHSETTSDDHKLTLSDTLSEIPAAGHYKFTDDQINRIAKTEHGSHITTNKIGPYQTLPEIVRQHAIGVMSKNLRDGFPTSVDKFSEHNKILPPEAHTLVDSISGSNPREASKLYSVHHMLPEHIDKLTHKLSGEPSLHHIILNPDVPHSHAVHLMHTARDAWHSNLQAYAKRTDAKASVIHSLQEKHQLTPTDLDSINYYSMKDIPKEHFSDAEHAPYVAMNLEHHPSATKEDLHHLVDSLHTFSDNNNSTISSKMVNGILNHPNVNTSHINRIMDKWGHDWMVKNTIEDHNRTPPSIHHKLMTHDFNQAE
jgi:hypothetical protein